MKSMTEHWTKEDLFVYTLLYCAHADFDESIYEEAEIKAKYPSSNYKLIHEEFIRDSDFERTEKIMRFAQTHQMNRNDFDDLLNYIPTLLNADGKISPEEEVVLHGLHEMINSL